jgi:hypothetical protein
MIKLKSLILENVEVIGVDELQPEHYDQLNKMVQESGIRILSDKELDTIYLVDGNVAGGLWTSYRNNVFSFDTIVGKDYQNMAIGVRIIKQGLSMYKSLLVDDPEAKLELDVVNKRLVAPLQNWGLKVIGVEGGHTIMGYGDEQND